LEFTEKGQNIQENPESSMNSEKNSNSAAGFVNGNSGNSGSGLKHMIGYLVIGMVNLAGIVIIAKILKKS
jgi:2,3-bisphosphoglycerate-independent phosphoglycerate mutase